MTLVKKKQITFELLNCCCCNVLIVFIYEDIILFIASSLLVSLLLPGRVLLPPYCSIIFASLYSSSMSSSRPSLLLLKISRLWLRQRGLDGVRWFGGIFFFFILIVDLAFFSPFKLRSSVCFLRRCNVSGQDGGVFTC